MQVSLFPSLDKPTLPKSNGAANKLDSNDRAFHDWYRFVLSFPPHLVREYIYRFGFRSGETIFDPFCGTGTTFVEAKRLSIGSIGFETNPMTHFASSVKVDWDINPDALMEHAFRVAESARKAFAALGDQASYLQVMIRTGQLLADIAQSLGYELVSIDLFRTRLATATRKHMREEVIVLRWPGNKR